MDFEPKLIEYSFGIQTCRMGDQRRTIKNPFKDEWIEVVSAGRATSDELARLLSVLDRHGFVYDDGNMDYRGELDGTVVILPNVDLRILRVGGELRQFSFSGADVDIVGETISDLSLAVVLEMTRAAKLRCTTSLADCPNAVPTEELVQLVEDLGDGDVMLVDTVDRLRQWLDDHVGRRMVI